MIVPVIELSLWVTPCWTRSPMTTSRIRSNGSIELSSRRPTARVTSRIRKKTKVVRRTRSISGQHRDVGVDRHERRVGVVELDADRAGPDARRVDLELQPDDEPVAGVERVVAEDHLAVAARLADRLGLVGVELQLLEEPAVEDEARVLDRPQCPHLDAALEEQPAADRAWHRELQARRGAGAGDRAGLLAEDVGEREDDEHHEGDQQDPAQPGRAPDSR